MFAIVTLAKASLKDTYSRGKKDSIFTRRTYEVTFHIKTINIGKEKKNVLIQIAHNFWGKVSTAR